MKNASSTKKIISAAVTIVVIILIIAVAGFIGYKSCVQSAPVNEYRVEATEESGTEGGKDLTVSGSEKSKKAKNPIDFKSLQKKNFEAFGWIYIPGTNVDYPILQSESDDNFYLHRDLNKDYKYAGSIYMQYCNSSEMTDRVSVLYGHNMMDGSMFASLHRFESQDFFDKHRWFYIYLPKQKLTYEIVSAYEFDSRHIMNSYNFAENKIFKDYLETIQNPRALVSNVREKLHHKLTIKDKIVTLSTCLDSGDGRYLLQGVLVKDESTR